MWTMILDYALQAVVASGFLGLAALAFVFVPLPWKFWAVGGCLGVFVATCSYTAGYHKMQMRSVEFSKQYQEKLDARDTAINKNQRELADALADAREQLDRKDNAYDLYLPKPSGACPLGDADRDWLQSIK